MTSINDLDNMTLAKIFENLPIVDGITVPHVCKKWKRASWLVTNWNRFRTLSTSSVTYKNRGSDFKTKHDIKSVLSRCGRYLKHLTLECNFDSSIMPIVSEYCSNLLSIYINFNKYNDDDFKNAFKKMSTLKSVKIIYFPMYDVIISVDDDTVRRPLINDTKILSNMLSKTVEELSFCVNPMLNKPLANNFANELKHFTELHSLELVRSYLGNEMLKVIPQLKKLVRLNLSGAYWYGDSMAKIWDLNNLEFLDLSNCPVTDREIRIIAKKCNKLKYLNVRNCVMISNLTLLTMKDEKTFNLITHVDLGALQKKK
ncbi:hypothetical protein HCN44_001492 [Aphidius gifuensis]|uniref:F-box domain-containing protein n=1 Tax=Aphidius gifuensis TaxID=684658 RepID=A0A834XV29_APHGI|nr:uncharacterized protein LOC122853332 [Aphidius gifuensis]KAF7992167.1 hypothetical protein HCN44_001492 [Aphidius gifuensis]